MNIIEIIDKKKRKQELTKEEIEYFVKEYTKGNIQDYQASALIMAIYINGMTDEETTNLTLSMAYSGEVLDLKSIGTVVDKHSTGGVGDKITLILMPIMAALGVPVAKMSGRALGFTGGTADKLESIPGYKVDSTTQEFIENVKKIGISLITQTLNLAPADKKIYALRDAISCTDSIPLIASSIMSKKIAAGASKIVLDVTCGSGAFMKTKEEAIKLANTMKSIGKLAGKDTICIITNMDEPLGYSVGNTLEVIEAIEALKGNMDEDVKEIVLELGANMLKLAGKGENIQQNKEKIQECITSQKAYNKFKQLVQNQNGDVNYIENINLFEKAKYKQDINSKESGYIEKIDALGIGNSVNYLGAGRIKKEDKIDKTAGAIIYKKVGDYIEKGEKIITLYTNDISKMEYAKEITKNSIKINNKKIEKNKNIIAII